MWAYNYQPRLPEGGAQVRGCHPSCCFHTLPRKDRGCIPLALCNSLRNMQRLRFPGRTVLWCAPMPGVPGILLDSEFSVVLVKILMISNIRKPFLPRAGEWTNCTCDDEMVLALCLEDWGIVLAGRELRFYPASHVILFGEESTIVWRCFFFFFF